MSRRIDWQHTKLSDEDRAYLLSRGRRSEILANDRRFAEDGEGAPETSWEDEVDAMTVAELKEELTARGLPATGAKAELQNRLYEAGPED